MRIFLTGASGFIGSFLLEQLAATDHQVAVLLRKGSNRARISRWLNRVQVVKGDLAATKLWEDELTRFGPETVIHLAWGGVLNSARNDASQSQNVEQTVGLVRLAHRAGAKTWIGLGSQAEYGPCNQRADESFPSNPTTLYGKAKLAACTQSRDLAAQLGLRFAWLRLFSSYGPGDDPSWLIPSLILKLQAGERPALTAGEQKWDYIYAGDTAEAVLQTALSPNAEGIFNLGSGQARPLREIIETVRDLVRPGAPLGFGEVPYRPDQVMFLEANIDRLKRLTGWSPRTPLTDGLKRTVAYYVQTSKAA